MFGEKLKQLRVNALADLNPKQRQWLLLFGISMGFFAVMWLMFVVGDKSPKRPPPSDPVGVSGVKGPSTPILAAGQTVKPADIWIAKAGQDLDQLKKDREELKAKTVQQEKASKEMLLRFEELQKKLAQAPSAAPAASAPLPAPASAAPVASAPLPTPAKSTLPPLPPPPRPTQQSTSPIGGPLPGDTGSTPYTSPAATLTRVSLGDAKSPPPSGLAASSAPQAAAGKEPTRTVDNFLPISFTKAVLLGGLDAPTGGQSQSNPHPVFLRLEDDAMLPNKFRGQVRECFVVGAGYGDLSSERAYIRTEKLSCTRQDGVVIEIPVKGSVFGEDGKVGVRGRLVSKQGQVLANALVAGVVSGIGAGVSAAATSTTTTPLGNVQTVDGNQAFQAGLGQGFSKAMDRLAQYYIQLAEKMFPIIEVDAGRLVDVVLTEGAPLEVPLNAAASRDADASYYRSARQRNSGARSHED